MVTRVLSNFIRLPVGVTQCSSVCWTLSCEFLPENRVTADFCDIDAVSLEKLASGMEILVPSFSLSHLLTLTIRFFFFF
jgi:hypothetical protein